MTFTELTNKLRYDLDDMGLDFFVPADFELAITNALDKFTLLNGTCETWVNFVVQANFPYYDLYSMIPSYFGVSEAYNKATKQYLSFRTPVQLMQMREDYELWKGQIQFITVVDYRRVGFFPFPAMGTVDLILKLKLSAKASFPVDEVYTPAHADDIILNLAKQQLLEHAEEITKAATSYNAAIGSMKDSKRFSNGRPFPNFAMSMLGVDLKTFSPLP